MRRQLASLALATALATPTLVSAKDIEVRFSAKVGDLPLECGRTYADIGAPAASLTLQDFRIFISNVRLIDARGRERAVKLTANGPWQGGGVALLDFENATGNCNGNAATNAVIKLTAPRGDYRGLAFDLGVPATLNHQDPTAARAPLNVSTLSWPWRVGYKFTTIDVETSAPGGTQASGFSIHLGSTDCGQGSPTTPPDQPCSRPNRPTYRLEAFDPSSQVVVLDLAALLSETDITRNMPGTPAGCMSGQGDDDCVGVMRKLGVPFREAPGVQQGWVRSE